MSLSEHEPKKETEATEAKKKKPLTADEQEQKALREELQKINRQFYTQFWAKKNQRVLRYRQSDGTPVGVDEVAPHELAGMGAGDIPLSLPKGMERGRWYDLYETDINEGENKEYIKDAVKVFVTQDGMIRPQINLDNTVSNALSKDPYGFWGGTKNFNRIWTRTIRAYTQGMGVNELTLDFPNCYHKDGRTPNPEMYELINLDRVLKQIRLAEKEGAAVYIPSGSALEAKLNNPKNKKEFELAQKILQQAAQTQEALRSNPEYEKLRQRQSERKQQFYTDKLQTESKTLKEKSDQLKTASAAEFPDKLKEVEAARTSVDKRLGKIKEEFYAYHPSAELAKKYDTTLSTASKTISEVTATLNSDEVKGKVPAKSNDDFKALQENMTKLKESTDSLRKVAGVNAMTPEPRTKEKIKDLQEKVAALENAAQALNAAPADAKDTARENLVKAMQETSNAVRNVNSESMKTENSEKILKQYQDVMAETKSKISNAFDALAEVLPEGGKALEEKNKLDNAVGYTIDHLNAKINPAAEADKQFAADYAELQDKEVDIDEKRDLMELSAKRIDDRLDKLETQIKKLGTDLEDAKELDDPEDQKEEIDRIQTDIATFSGEIDKLEEHKIKFEKVNQEMLETSKAAKPGDEEYKRNEKVAEDFKKTEEKFKSHRELSSELNAKVDEMKVSAAPAPK